jgi:dipeptidyl aminopeptidase/acylaminoacyl peptidase
MAMVIVAAPLNSASLIRDRKNSEDTGDFPPSFYRENLQFDIADKVPAVDHLLVFHGDADGTVPVSHGQDIHALAGAPKKIIIQRGGDHRMSNPAHQRQFIQETVKWLDHCGK